VIGLHERKFEKTLIVPHFASLPRDSSRPSPSSLPMHSSFLLLHPIVPTPPLLLLCLEYFCHFRCHCDRREIWVVMSTMIHLCDVSYQEVYQQESVALTVEDATDDHGLDHGHAAQSQHRDEQVREMQLRMKMKPQLDMVRLTLLFFLNSCSYCSRPVTKFEWLSVMFGGGGLEERWNSDRRQSHLLH